MSKLSEQVQEAVDAMNRCDASSQIVDMHSAPNLKALDHLDEVTAYHGQKATQVVRKVYRHFAGSRPFESPEKALSSTYTMMLAEFVPIAVMALADGVQMGRKSSSCYKKYKVMNKLDEIFEASGFREESSLWCLNVLADGDTTSFVSEYITSTVRAMGVASGYAAQESPEAINKIWDLWSLAMKSVTVGLYAAGNHLGTRWEQQEILDGILSVSEESD